MTRKPRAAKEPLFTTRIVWASTLHGATVFAIGAAAFAWALPQDEDLARSLAFTALIVGNVVLMQVQRRAPVWANKWAAGLGLGALALLAAVLYVPVLQTIFSLSAPPLVPLLVVVAVSVVGVFTVGRLVPIRR